MLFSATTLATLPLNGYAPGHALVTVFVNGIPSAARIIRVDNPTPRPGDLDGDGDIDQSDYNLFRATFGRCRGQSGFNSNADYNGDGCINFVDYQIWYGYYKTR